MNDAEVPAEPDPHEELSRLKATLNEAYEQARADNYQPDATSMRTLDRAEQNYQHNQNRSLAAPAEHATEPSTTRGGSERERTADRRDRTAAQRDDLSTQRDHEADDRERLADARDARSASATTRADQRDRDADARHLAANHRDARADNRPQNPVGEAKADRAAAAADRYYAARDRAAAAADRVDATLDRLVSGIDRDDARDDRHAARSPDADPA